MTIDKWFAVPIYRTVLDIGDYQMNKMIEKSYEIKNVVDDGSSKWWNCNTYTTFSDISSLDNYTEFDFLFDQIKTHVNKFGEELLIESNSGKIQSWINISSPGNFQELHNHSGSHLSAVFYLKAPENSGDIVFRSFESFGNMFPFPSSGINEFTYETCKYKPKEKMLLIFKSNLLHMVNLNKSNEDRISVSANFIYD